MIQNIKNNIIINTGIIYKITNLINNKIYIGLTKKKIEERFSQHKRNNKSLISKAIKKYKKTNFIIEELYFSFSREDLEEKEIYFIKYFNSMSPNGYNLTSGEEKEKIYTKEVLIKLSKAKKGKKCIAQSIKMLGRKQSLEVRNKKALNRGMKSFFVIKKLTKEIVKKYNCCGICAEELNLDATAISRCLNKKRKSHKGYIFKFEVSNE
jgi:hypothetical protein